MSKVYETVPKTVEFTIKVKATRRGEHFSRDFEQAVKDLACHMIRNTLEIAPKESNKATLIGAVQENETMVVAGDLREVEGEIPDLGNDTIRKIYIDQIEPFAFLGLEGKELDREDISDE